MSLLVIMDGDNHVALLKATP